MNLSELNDIRRRRGLPEITEAAGPEAIYNAFAHGKPIPLTEMPGGGPSRVQGMIRSGVPFLTIRAFRPQFSPIENRQRNARMLHDFRQHGLGGLRMIGAWVEPGTGEKSMEESFFIPLSGHANLDPSEFIEVGIALTHKYEQSGLVYGDGDDIWLYDRQSTRITKIGTRASFTVADLEGSFRIIKGRKFVFESYISADTWVSGVILTAAGLSPIIEKKGTSTRKQ